MKKLLTAAACLTLLAATVIAQDTIRRTETTEVRTENGTVTQTTQITTVVQEYVTYLRRVYTSVGVSEDVILKVIYIDMEIFVARVRLDFVRVRTLVQQQVEILTPVVAQKVVTYVRTSAPPASLPVYARPVWTDNVTFSGTSVNVQFNEQEVRTAVQTAKVDVSQVEQVTKSVDVKTGKVSGAAATGTTVSGATPAAGAAATPKADETPKAGETPQSTATPKAAETPKSTPTPKADETPKAADTPRASDTPKAGETPKSTPTPKADETPKAADTPRARDTPKADETPKAAKPAKPAMSGKDEAPAAGQTPAPAATSSAASKPESGKPATPPSASEKAKPGAVTPASSGAANKPADPGAMGASHAAPDANKPTGSDAAKVPGASEAGAAKTPASDSASDTAKSAPQPEKKTDKDAAVKKETPKPE
ncbi:MAG: hypothetical protein ACR2IE_03320 [Candidatus Sumerlaeaceae bacterium]